MKKEVGKTLCLIALLGVAIVYLLSKGIIVFDHSARRAGEGFRWNGVLYIPASAEDYTEGKTIAKTTDNWQLNIVEEDESHTFMVMRSFLDQWLCVREDYEFPKEGNVTAVYIDGKKIDNAELAAAAQYMLENFTAERDYAVESIRHDTETQQMRDISYCFEGCPVGIDRNGDHIGRINGEWVFARREGEAGGLRTYKICAVPEEYVEILGKYCG